MGELVAYGAGNAPASLVGISTEKFSAFRDEDAVQDRLDAFACVEIQI